MEYLNEEDFNEFMEIIQEGHVLNRDLQGRSINQPKLRQVSPEAAKGFDRANLKNDAEEILDERFLNEKKMAELKAAVIVYDKRLAQEESQQDTL